MTLKPHLDVHHTGFSSDKNQQTVVFQAGTKLDKGKLLTNGGRVLGVTAIGSDINKSIKNAYSEVDEIEWDGMHYRKDIGSKAK